MWHFKWSFRWNPLPQSVHTCLPGPRWTFSCRLQSFLILYDLSQYLHINRSLRELLFVELLVTFRMCWVVFIEVQAWSEITPSPRFWWQRGHSHPLKEMLGGIDIDPKQQKKKKKKEKEPLLKMVAQGKTPMLSNQTHLQATKTTVYSNGIMLAMFKSTLWCRLRVLNSQVCGSLSG